MQAIEEASKAEVYTCICKHEYVRQTTFDYQTPLPPLPRLSSTPTRFRVLTAERLLSRSVRLLDDRLLTCGNRLLCHDVQLLGRISEYSSCMSGYSAAVIDYSDMMAKLMLGLLSPKT